MDLELAPADEAARATIAELLDEHSPVAVVRAAEPLGFHQVLWDALFVAGVTDWGTVHGFGLLGLAKSMHEVGARIAPVTLAEHWTATRLVAAAEGAGILAADPLTIALRPSTSGRAGLVPAGAVAPLLVAVDHDELVLVGPPEVLPPSPRNTATSPIADRDLGGENAGTRVVLATGARAHQLHAGAVDEWRVLTAAALAGLGRRALDLAVAHVLDRHQFGVAIGSFQAVQHRLADIVTALDAVDLLVAEAAWAAHAEPARAPSLAVMAFVAATDAARASAAASLQLHGGYGYTLDRDVQLYYRRAKGWPMSLGDPAAELDVLADRLWPRTAGVA
ncbi:MAG: acyl-CoA dehydrogenase protein [Actinomycetia bacterium]|nr:acyl-CoA dehydrogenase protein [Actinomycetes bacterium]